MISNLYQRKGGVKILTVFGPPCRLRDPASWPPPSRNICSIHLLVEYCRLLSPWEFSFGEPLKDLRWTFIHGIFTVLYCTACEGVGQHNFRAFGNFAAAIMKEDAGRLGAAERNCGKSRRLDGRVRGRWRREQTRGRTATNTSSQKFWIPHGSLEPPAGQGLTCSQETKCTAVFYDAYRF